MLHAGERMYTVAESVIAQLNAKAYTMTCFPCHGVKSWNEHGFFSGIT